MTAAAAEERPVANVDATAVPHIPSVPPEGDGLRTAVGGAVGSVAGAGTAVVAAFLAMHCDGYAQAATLMAMAALPGIGSAAGTAIAQKVGDGDGNGRVSWGAPLAAFTATSAGLVGGAVAGYGLAAVHEGYALESLALVLAGALAGGALSGAVGPAIHGLFVADDDNVKVIAGAE